MEDKILELEYINNSKKITSNTSTSIYKPIITSNDEIDMILQFKKQANRAHWNARKKNNGKIYSVSIRIIKPKKTKKYLYKQLTLIMDSLVKAGIIPDDDLEYIQELYITSDITSSNKSKFKIFVEEYNKDIKF